MRNAARHSGTGPTQGRPLPVKSFSSTGNVEGHPVVLYLGAYSRADAERKLAAAGLSGFSKPERAPVPDAVDRAWQGARSKIHYRKLTLIVGVGKVEGKEVFAL